MFAFIRAHGSPGVMPTNDELRRAARSDLASAVGKHGGYPVVAEKLSLSLRYVVKRNGHWDDFSNIRSAVTRFLEAGDKKGVMPTKDELCKRGHSGLASAIQRHGGFGAVAERLGLRLSYSTKPKKYWKDLENLDKEIRAFIENHGTSGVLPSQGTLKQHGRLDLTNAIRNHGGHKRVAEILNFRRTGNANKLKVASNAKPKPYLSDFQNFERELRAYIKEQGTPGNMPTNPQLRRDRRFGLAKAITSFGGFQAVAERLGLYTPKKQRGYWDSLENVEHEIITFNKARGVHGLMPTQKELRENRSSLAAAIIKLGGFESVANQLGLKLSHRPRRPAYYKDPSNFERELKAFIENEGKTGVMPTHSELRAAKRLDLANAINKLGGFESVARQFGLQLSYTSKRRGYWKDFSNVENELTKYIEEFGRVGEMPTSTELENAGHSSLTQAIVNRYGGFEAVAKRLNLKYETKRHGYWTDFDNLKKEVLELAEKVGAPDVMPTQDQLKELGGGIVRAIVQKHGGLRSVATRLGLKLSYTSKPKGHWSDIRALERELLAHIAKHGVPGVMPTQEELYRANRSDLIHAITRHHGGIGSVAKKLGLSLTHDIKPAGYWEDEANFKRELLEYVGEHGKSGVMPTAATLSRDKRNDLVNAMRHHGGLPAVAQKFGLKMSYKKKPLGYWNDFKNVERGLQRYIEEFGTPGVMPSHNELMAAGFTDLSNAVSKHGGSGRVASLLGLRYTPVRVDPATAASVERIARAIQPLAESNLLTGAQNMVILRRAGLLEHRNQRILRLSASLARGDHDEIEAAIAGLSGGPDALKSESILIDETGSLSAADLDMISGGLNSPQRATLADTLLRPGGPDEPREQAAIQGLSSLGELRLPLDQILGILTSKVLWEAFYRRLYLWYGNLDLNRRVSSADIEASILSAYPEHTDNEFVAKASAQFASEVEAAINFAASLSEKGWRGPRLRLHQADAARRMAEVLSGAAAESRFLLEADDPGTGKSASFLAAVCSSGVSSVLLVAPKTVSDDTWSARSGEIKHCLPDATIYRGWEKLGNRPSARKTTFYVLHYEELLREEVLGTVSQHEFGCLCLDEIHLAKQRTGQEPTYRREKLEQLRGAARVAIGLTGTPLVNELTEPMSLMQLLSGHDPRFDYARLSNRRMSDVADVFEALLPHIIRRRKSEVLLHLPGCDVRTVDIPLPQDVEERAAEIYSWPKSRASQALVELRKLATDAKLPYLLDKAATASKLLILTYLTDHVSEKIYSYLNEFFPGQVAHINGQTPKTREERQREIESFREEKGKRVLVGTVRTIGVGLTLFDPSSASTASEIIFADLPYTWAEFEQGVARLYREGQRHTVTVDVLQTTSSGSLRDGAAIHTLDERVWSLIEGKRDLSDVAIDGKYGTTDASLKVQQALRKWLKHAREIGVEPLAVSRRPAESSEAQRWRSELGRLRSLSSRKADEVFSNATYRREFLDHLKVSTASRISHQWLRGKLTLLTRPDLTVVDMGCGHNLLSDLPCKVIGLDRHGLPGQIQGKMENPPLPDNSADVLVYSLSLYGTAFDLLSYFTHAARILRGGGHLFIVEPSSTFTPAGLSKFLNGLRSFGFELVSTVKEIRSEEGSLLKAMHFTLTGEVGVPVEADFERK
jgi:hypothetical protein